MWLVQATGKPHTRLLAEGWTWPEIIRSAGCKKLLQEIEAEANKVDQ